MDPSAFIFVGLAVAWAAYLIPKALEHHDAGARSRTVDRFSHTLRVIARREPVDRSRTRLVTPGRPAAETPADADPVVSQEPAEEPLHDAGPETTGFLPKQRFVRRSAAARAARRRRRVLVSILVLIALVAAVATGRVISWWWVAAPVALLAAWLVACRMMVKRERAARRPAVRRPPAEGPQADAAPPADDETAEVPAVRTGIVEATPIASGDGWELVPVTLPTYVSKPAAPRPVSTIDLESTGVWTSGRTAADSALAQQADAVRAERAEAARPQARHGA